MAHQAWSFDCLERCSQLQPHCIRCGRQGTYAGWSLSVVEMQCQYVGFFRWVPYGGHRLVADEVMAPITGKCRECDGAGIHAEPCDRGFDQCTTCGGTGRVRVCSDEEFERRRQEVIARTGLFTDQHQPVSDGGAA